MRSKSALACIWVAATVAAVTIVWQSLGFVSTRTDDAADRAGGGPVATASTSAPPPSLTGATGGTTDTSAVTVPASDASGGAAPTTGPAPSGAATAPPPAGAVDQTFELVGGSTTVRYADGGVTVLWAVPAAGFTASIEPEDSGQKVEFRSAGHRSRVDVWWADGPRHEIREEAEEDDD